jgi:hypothetical protein
MNNQESKSIIWITNPTKCCWQSYPNPNCKIHTREWVKQEAERRRKEAAEQATFEQQWTHKLADFIPKVSGRKVGERLIELGLRVYDDTSETYDASAAALDDRIATIRDRHGYPTLFWHRERVAAILLDGADSETTQRWIKSNNDREKYDKDMSALDAIIDHESYLTSAEQMQILGMDKSGIGNPQTLYRQAVKRAYSDRRDGKPLKLRPVTANMRPLGID